MKRYVFIDKKHSSRRIFVWALAFFAVALFSSTLAFADTIVRAFNSRETLQPGWIVALDKDSEDTVDIAPADDPSRMYGVVIDPSKSPVTLKPQKESKIYVATSGTYHVLVTTQNGQIAAGDYLSMSSNDGIGAKAGEDQSYILGQALEKFDGISGVISGGGRGVAIGRILVTILPGKNPLQKVETPIPLPLLKAGEALAGKSVSAVRVYAALAVFLAAALISVSVLWVGVRSGMVAIGRNPLSKPSIIQGLMQVVAVATLVFIIGVFAVYLLLRI